LGRRYLKYWRSKKKLSKRCTTEEWIAKATKVHGDKYDYSKVIYINNDTNIIIGCPIHGQTLQDPQRHIHGVGCQKCAINTRANKKRTSLPKFIEIANSVHGNKYSYEQVHYKNANTKIDIICHIHGVFQQTPNAHLRGQGCPKCGDIATANKLLKPSADSFVERATVIHNGKYDYSLVNYVGANTKVSIICPIHGVFTQRPGNHLNGEGCSLCANIYKADIRSMGKEEFVRRANIIHDGRFTYDKVVYKNFHDKVIITCPVHGDFLQSPSNHLAGKRCYKCGLEHRTKSQTKDENVFIQEASLIHSNYYLYNKVEYKNTGTKVCIICPNHGEFWQTPNAHLSGSCCPKCKSSLGEQAIERHLIQKGIPYIAQYRDHTCIVQRPLAFDFAVFSDTQHKDIAALIEFDGLQHYKPIEAFGGEAAFLSTQYYDKVKNEYCLTNNIKLIRIHYNDMKNITSILDKELNIES
jgi:hypothetical protein